MIFFSLLKKISIAIISNIIIVVPNLLLVEFFRRCRKRFTRSANIKKAIFDYKIIRDSSISDSGPVPNNKKISSTRKRLTFPWWCKILAYIVSFILAIISLFFILMKGISLNNQRATDWLTSIIMSISISLLLTQPLQASVLFFSWSD